MSVKLYEVGGHVRDGLLGVKSNDIDYSVEASSWEEMQTYVHSISQKVFLEKPEYLTIRSLVDGEVRDFVMCRKDGAYSDGRRPDEVTPGTIYDDLKRRDFSINAIARCSDTGKLLDPHGGLNDIKAMTLRAVGSAHDRFAEDSLRVIRAIRFIITKGFFPDREIESILLNGSMSKNLMDISTQRISEELKKCFKFSTSRTVRYFGEIHPEYSHIIFDEHKLWLEPTMKAK